MTKQRIRKAVLAVILSIAMSTQAFAAVIEHNISESDLEITSNNGDTYYVYQTDSNATQHTITVSDGVTTTITLDNVNIASTSGSGIDIGANSDVTIELVGDNTVTAETGAAVHVSDGDLTITDKDGDSETGSLTAQGGEPDAAIGTNAEENLTGSINITGGIIDAAGDDDGAGIGTGRYGNIEESGSINISGGEITAQGGRDAAGIGTGLKGHLSMDGSINISGGEITAQGGEDGAGIGTGDSGIITGNASINISGGDVTAQGGDDAAGIGTGVISNAHAEDPANNPDIPDSNGEVPALQRGTMQGYGAINITGGNVTATGGTDGAGIGTGSSSTYYNTMMVDASAINISGGTVTATGGNNAAGIGTGKYSSMQDTSSINISGDAVVTVNGGKNGAGIGTGDMGDLEDSSSVNISGGEVTATSVKNGAGIGTGRYGYIEASGSVNISGGNVTATGGTDGAGIGTGNQGNIMHESSISITGNADVTATAGSDELKPIGTGNGMIISSPRGNKVSYTIGSEATINGEKITDKAGAADIFQMQTLCYCDGGCLDCGFTGYVDADILLNFVDKFTPVFILRYIIWNEDHDISAVVTSTAVKELVETELDDEQAAALIGEDEGDKVLVACVLNYDVESEVSCNLRFHLGAEYIGKKVEIRQLVDGKVVVTTVTVSAAGLAVLLHASLDTAFAVVLAD